MNYYQTLSRLAAEHQQRRPGSAGAAATIEQITTLAAAWKLNSETIKVSGCQLQNSLWAMTTIGLLAFLSGFFIPMVSLGGAILLGVALLRELSRPFLGKTPTAPGENLLFNLPAKNKEAQKVFLIASYDTEPFIKTPFAFKPGLYPVVIFGIIALMAVMSLLYLLKLGVIFNCLNLLLVTLLAIFNLAAKNPPRQPATLKNCAALLETVAILNKVKPDITSVALCFCGARALNSGISALVSEFAKGPEDLTYVVNLTESNPTNASTLQCLTSEGTLPVKNASSILLGLLQEVAEEKSLTLTTGKTNEHTETYPLNRYKIQPLSIIVPQDEAVSLRDVRELLCGLIRKLDH
jgi:hypothetical protein